MLTVKENFDLSDLNTFKVNARSRFFIELNDISSVKEILTSEFLNRNDCLILSGGSNILFTKDFEGIVIHPLIKGIEIIYEDKSSIKIRIGAGEIWDNLVEYCVDNGWGGLENLSMIPGFVGAAPVQNIGAYGVEVMEYIESVEFYFLKSGIKEVIKKHECKFGYRNSIFKNELKNKVLITHVIFVLNKGGKLNTSYPEVKKALDNFDDTTIENIRKAVINIRKDKLPDPAVTGNAGSFFKNPVISKERAYDLKNFFPQMPQYKFNDDFVKLSAAWLIEQCGWKGKVAGNVATHNKQPLIIINKGGATGKEVYQLAQKIQKAVMNRFAIKLETEVNIL